MTWTDADQAELDVLVHALTSEIDGHRRGCVACQPCPELDAWRAHKSGCPACLGDAPLTFGRPCDRRETWLAHNRAGCVRCLPCPHLQAAIREVCDWKEARQLLSNAEALRAERGQTPAGGRTP